MDGKKLDYYQEKLRQKQLSLTNMVQRTEGYSREKDPDTQDVADMAVESYTQEFNFGKSSGDRYILQLIREALDRIKKSPTEPVSIVRTQSAPRDWKPCRGRGSASHARVFWKRDCWKSKGVVSSQKIEPGRVPGISVDLRASQWSNSVPFLLPASWSRLLASNRQGDPPALPGRQQEFDRSGSPFLVYSLKVSRLFEKNERSVSASVSESGFAIGF